MLFIRNAQVFSMNYASANTSASAKFDVLTWAAILIEGNRLILEYWIRLLPYKSYIVLVVVVVVVVVVVARNINYKTLKFNNMIQFSHKRYNGIWCLMDSKIKKVIIFKLLPLKLLSSKFLTYRGPICYIFILRSIGMTFIPWDAPPCIKILAVFCIQSHLQHLLTANHNISILAWNIYLTWRQVTPRYRSVVHIGTLREVPISRICSQRLRPG